MIKKSLQILKRNLSRPRGIDFESVYPVSDYYGDDRGTPIDRYYIEKFMSSNRELVQGNTLEVAESTYSKRYGTNLLTIDVLHYETGAPHATIIGDLTRPDELPADRFDCFICTQTFHVIYNYMDAIRGAYRMLRPGGTLLATLSGIAQISRYDMDRWGDYWRFTTLSAQRSFEEVFGPSNVMAGYYGNCYAAVNFLRGIALEEVRPAKLDERDPNYPVLVTIVAKKQVKR
ncbi:MAG TPA: methyltransferase domain-containing protein [Puia sp.]|nr:methyltransferase domain-containing protein [Puia sp.]